MRTFHLGIIAVCTIAPFSLLRGADEISETKAEAEIPAPEKSLKTLAVAPGLQVDIWAAEPLLANPVAFSFDEKGRCFVAETFRRRTSVPDIRKVMEWLPTELNFRSLEDRVAFMKRTFPENAARKPDSAHPDYNKDGQFDWRDFEVESERIELVEDRHGTGKADAATVYADGFNTVSTGIGAGVLARNGEVWYTCIPDLWKLGGVSDVAEHRTSLATGFGIHFVASGHDMHGVKMGPDGKIYWSVADCGGRVTTREGHVIDVADMGAVFRINPDGSDMELVAKGMRNPQSLAFNDLGDLFTGDNNADGGDKARWLHVVEGGEYGWRNGYQYLPELGVWNSEKLWELNTAQSASYLLPPVGHVAHGPAGIVYYPGTGLPDTYREHFFCADFPGGVRSFAVRPAGASYTLDNPGEVFLNNSPKEMSGKLLWNLYPSDAGFGTDGGVYVLDWVYGWEKTGKGRMFRVHDPVVDKSEVVLETKRLLAEGMDQRSEAETARLLGHVDQRVRLAAQFSLAARGAGGVAQLQQAAQRPAEPDSHTALLARLHALWGLGQAAHVNPAALDPVPALLKDMEAEVRAQSAKVLGDARRPGDEAAFEALLQDSAPRPRFFAAMGLAKLGNPKSVQSLLQALQRNTEGDAFLRHAYVYGLTLCASPDTLLAAAHDPSTEVRLGVLLALRRLHRAEVKMFLEDANPSVVREAARAIHDEFLDEDMLELASFATRPGLAAPVMRRAIDACYLVGSPGTAQTVAGIAVNSTMPEELRREALAALVRWNTAPGRDGILGTWRPPFGAVGGAMPARDAEAGASVAEPVVRSLLQSGPESLRHAAADAAGALTEHGVEAELVALAADKKAGGKSRAAALKALEAINSSKLEAALDLALAEKDSVLLAEARRLLLKLFPERAAAAAAAELENGSPGEQQAALKVLAVSKSPATDRQLADWLDRLNAGRVPAALQLDLLESAAKRNDPDVQQKLAAYERGRNSADPIALWRECLEGGDAKAGRQIFLEKAEAACVRCHKIAGAGGDVGPDLEHVGAKYTREYLLTSVVLPNAAIAPGFEMVALTMKDGSVVAGLLAKETAEELTLTPLGGGQPAVVKKAAIAERTTAPSPMPAGLGEVLGKRGLRDVVEFLSTLH